MLELSRDDEDAVVDGVLRWLVSETEAEAAAYFSLRPGGGERFRVEPRGLPPEDLGFLARAARDAIVQGEADEGVNEPTAVSRWLGGGGSKILVLRGAAGATSDDALRFARFAIELFASERQAEAAPPLEQRVRLVPGVAWAELSGGDPPTLRVLFARNAEPVASRQAVELAAGDSEATIEEIEPAAHRPTEEPRARLIDLTVSLEGHPSVDVVIDWKGQRLRGRGHGRSTQAGRSYASAEAVADAMKPLLDSDVAIEGLYQADSSDGLNVLVAAVRVGEERYVGAVVSSKGEEDVSGARAVLDALNRRLPHIAGKAGRV